MNVVVTPMTAEEFMALPDEPGKQELLHGELIALPPAKQRHNAVARRFYEKLQAILHPSRVWIETGYQMKSGWLQPDVSVIWPDQKTGDWFEGAPMIAVEVVSPGNRDKKLEQKIAAYLTDGGLEVWLVRPEERDMTVYTPTGVIQVADHYVSDLLGHPIDVSALIGGLD